MAKYRIKNVPCDDLPRGVFMMDRLPQIHGGVVVRGALAEPPNLRDLVRSFFSIHH